ncbi:MAG: hypothetical protein K5981_03485, partial [Clostridia bacterium]|nr:hypothetical protein [Clostridia bacterium]
FQFCCIFHGVSFTVVMAQSYQNPSKTICGRQKKRGRVSPRTSLKVVLPVVLVVSNLKTHG